MPYDKFLAAGGTVGTMTPLQLFAGEAPIMTDAAPANVAETGGVAIYDVLALQDDHTVRRLVAEDVVGPPALTADSPFRVVIAAQPGKAGDQIPYYEAGAFNHEQLNWPDELDTYEKRKVFMQGTMIRVRHLI